MRCYISVIPDEVREFLSTGQLSVSTAMTVTQTRADENPEADEEELEFDVSVIAAKMSKLRQASEHSRGFVLALEVPASKTGTMSEEGVNLVEPLQWSYVEAILVSDSEEEELSWYAPQEAQVHLASWLS